MSETEPPDNCEQCGHDNGPHVLLSFDPEPVSGIRLCPTLDCQCFATWAINDFPRELVKMPPPAEIAALRHQIQTKPLKKA